MSAHAYDVCLADFDDKVLAASRHVPVIVDFWAPWCQPCRILKPLLEKLAAESGGKFLLAKINSDENQELATRYGVRGIPAVKAFVAGEPVDEFTGALPEAQVREFIGRLLPSPAEPLRREAMALAAAGDPVGARRALADAIHLDPANDRCYLDFIELALSAAAPDALAEAQALMAIVADRARDRDRVDSLQARLKLAHAGSGADITQLQSRIDVQPDDHAARLQLAQAQALAQDYRNALGHLLEIVRRDRWWNEEAGRKAMLDLFTLLATQPQFDGLLREYRVALSRTLN